MAAMKILVIFGLLPLIVTSFTLNNQTEVGNGAGKINPEPDSQQVPLRTMAKFIPKRTTTTRGGGDVNDLSRAFKWGCRFLYTPCSVLNALNPFTDTDCCVGSCLPSWSRTWTVVEWKCTPPAVDRYLIPGE